MPISRLIALLAALAFSGAALAEAPKRVVSINLCTDQYALMLAAPGQLVSVTHFAHDPRRSVHWEKARALPGNGSGAEEVYLLAPDLVLAGSYTAPATLSMLRGLGMRVEVFAPETSLSDIPDRLRQMGRALGREAEAEAQVAAFDARLAELTARAPELRPRAAIWEVNSYALGDRTLAGDILNAAGFDNIAAGLDGGLGGRLSLEQLVMESPDFIIRGRDYPGRSRGEEVLDHPALAALPGVIVTGAPQPRDWICATPRVLDVVERLADLREGRR